MERDTTLIGTSEVAKITKRSEQMARRLLAAQPPIFKTATNIARNWVVERGEVEEWAAANPPRKYRKP